MNNTKRYELKEENKKLKRIQALEFTKESQQDIIIDFRYSYDEELKEQISQDNRKKIELSSLIWHAIRSIDKVCSWTKNSR